MKVTDKLVRTLTKMTTEKQLQVLRPQRDTLNFALLHKKVKEQVAAADVEKNHKLYDKLYDLSEITGMIEMWNRWPPGSMEIEWEDGVIWN